MSIATPTISAAIPMPTGEDYATLSLEVPYDADTNGDNIAEGADVYEHDISVIDVQVLFCGELVSLDKRHWNAIFAKWYALPGSASEIKAECVSDWNDTELPKLREAEAKQAMRLRMAV